MIIDMLTIDQLPRGGIELAGLAIITIGGVIHLLIQQRAGNKRLREVHEQTVNDHKSKSNMRDDLDTTRDATLASHDVVSEIRDITRDMQERQMAQGREIFGLRTDMTGIRTDMTGLRTDVTGVNDRLSHERERSIRTDEALWRAIQDRPPADE